jgi:hypothetical protein
MAQRPSRSPGIWHPWLKRVTLTDACRLAADDGSPCCRRNVAAGSATSPPPDRSGEDPPVGHVQFPHARALGQPPGSLTGSRRWHPCCRRCLLKGCECWFLPQWPQARYCSPACQHAARCWRRWHASQRYRATTRGKQHRQEQTRRYRSRRQQRATCPDPEPPSPPVEAEPHPVEAEPHPVEAEPHPVEAEPHPVEPEPSVVEPEPPPTTVLPTTLPSAGEGQRPAKIPDDPCGLPCDRPGCYVVFLPTPRSPQQHFCSCLCRQALRRVRQREARLQKRQRCGARPLSRSHRGPPTTAPFMSSRIIETSL